VSPRLRQVAGWALGAGLVVVLLLSLDTAAIGSLLAHANLPLVVFAVTGLTAAHLVGAATWRSLADRLSGIRLAWRSAVPLYYAAQAVGGLTPANIGNDTYRVVALRRSGHGTEGAAAPIVVQRATSYLALGLLGMGALLALTRPAGLPTALGAAFVVLASCAAVTAIVVWRSPGWSFVPDRRAFADAVGIGLGLGLVFHLAGICLSYLLIVAVDPAAAATAGPVLASVALARATLLVPLTPSGLGIQEAALAFLLSGLGIPPETALAASLLGRLGLVLTTVVGAICLARMSRGAEPDQLAVTSASPVSR